MSNPPFQVKVSEDFFPYRNPPNTEGNVIEKFLESCRVSC